MRIKFKKGEQRKFLQKVLEKSGSPSLRELVRRGFDVPYSTLKNYFSEQRFLPEDLFRDLIKFADLDAKDFSFEIVGENWGQSKGGRRRGELRSQIVIN